MDARTMATLWTQDPAFDTTTQQEAREILMDDEKLLATFGTELHFGTGGLRGFGGVTAGEHGDLDVLAGTVGELAHAAHGGIALGEILAQTEIGAVGAAGNDLAGSFFGDFGGDPVHISPDHI